MVKISVPLNFSVLHITITYFVMAFSQIGLSILIYVDVDAALKMPKDPILGEIEIQIDRSCVQ